MYNAKKLSSGFPTRSIINWAVQQQKIVRGLKFRILEVVYVANNKGADQLHGYRITVFFLLICTFVFAYTKSRFSYDKAHIIYE